MVNTCNPNTVFITGANRGIGLGLVKQFVQNDNPPEFIFATYRKKENAKDLFELAEINKSVKLVKLDVTDHSSFVAVVKEVTSVVGNMGINLLINNAGLLEPCQGLMEVTHQKMISTYETNAIGPLFLARAFLPLLRTAAQSEHGQELTWSRSAIINISSVMGSIELNATLPWDARFRVYAYRMSKTAMNMFTRSLSIDLKAFNILVCAFDPGWVQTEMGGMDAHLTVQEAMSTFIEALSNLDASSNGKYFSYDGKVLPY